MPGRLDRGSQGADMVPAFVREENPEQAAWA
jgi:hypothetical protein